MTADDLFPLVVRLEAEVAALRARLDPQPVTSWRGAAAVLAVSEDTLIRHRQRAGDATRPWWSSPDAVREWWAETAGVRIDGPGVPDVPDFSHERHVQTCAVYLMDQGDQYKIGISENPRERVRAICHATGRPTLLVGLCGFPSRSDAEYAESGLLLQLHAHRRLGEWFDRVPVVRDAFLALPGAADIASAQSTGAR